MSDPQTRQRLADLVNSVRQLAREVHELRLHVDFELARLKERVDLPLFKIE